MPRPELTHILVRDSDGYVTQMGPEAYTTGGGFTAYAGVDGSAYDDGPVMYDVVQNKLLPRLANIGSNVGYKTESKVRVAAVTKARIYADTFEYPAASGKLWSLSAEAQSSWHARMNAVNSFRDMSTLSTEQRTYYTWDDKASHEFTTNQAITDAYQAALEKVETHLEANRETLAAIDAATTRAEVDAAVDAYLAS